MASQGGSIEAAAVQVDINAGVIIGKHQPASEAYPKAVDIFYGIPYATTGRFQPARPCMPVEEGGVLDARREGKYVPCPMASFETEEGTLRLNIFRPSNSTRHDSAARAASLPVVVFIHGGAYNFSYPLERDLASLVAWAPRDILVVAVAYRLGPLGFMSDSSYEMNLGLRDQRTAIEWVVRWIGAFGGKQDITLMGISAGAHSAGHHLVHPSPAPFTKAILESGSPTARSVLSPQHPRSASQHLSLLEHARQPKTIPVSLLLNASMAVFAQHTESSTWPFQAVVDAALIPSIPLHQVDRLLETERVSRISLLTGFCSHEGTQFVPLNVSTNAGFRSWFANLIPSFTQDDLDLLEQVYPDPVTGSKRYQVSGTETSHGAQFRRLHEAYAHYAYICPILHTAHKLSAAGARVYLYEYAATSEPFNAASHGDQAPVVAHDMDLLAGQPGLVSVADEMNPLWAEFIASPEGEIESWPRFQSPFDGDGAGGGGQLLVFGKGNDEAAGGTCRGVAVQKRILTDEEVAQCRFWWERMELSQGMGVRGQYNNR